MPINSRRKGHDFEREIVKLLNKTYKITDDKSKWKRVPLSGGFDKNNFPGDVYTMSPDLNSHMKIADRISIECKHHKEWFLEKLINGTQSEILKWWKQSRVDAIVGGKLPLLVFQKNFSKTYYMIHYIEYTYYHPPGKIIITNDDIGDQVAVGVFEDLLVGIYKHDTEYKTE